MSQEFKITAKRNKLSVRYRYIKFPFAAGEFLDTLAKADMGYTVAPPPNAPPPPMGQVLDWSGMIASKGDVSIELDSFMQIMGCRADDITQLTNVFFEVIDILETSLVPNLKEYANFYEFISNYGIETGEAPLERLGRIIPEGKIYEKMKEILQEPILAYNFHIRSADKKIESTDWFNMNIQPTSRNSDRIFDVQTIYRDKDKLKVEKFASNYEDNLRKIFDELNKV